MVRGWVVSRDIPSASIGDIRGEILPKCEWANSYSLGSVVLSSTRLPSGEEREVQD